MTSLAGKTAIVTGASSGIGKGTSIHFSRLGALLTITGRNENELIKTAEECVKASGVKPLIVRADLAKEEDMRSIVEQHIAKYSKLDILVNNAGMLIKGTVENTKPEDFDAFMNVNCRSVYYMMHLCAPHLIASKGNIVNVSSINGIRAFAGVLAYNSSKGALDHMSRTVALELGKKHVRCNVVNPGVIVTDIHRRGGLSEEQFQNFLEHSKKTHALGRAGQVEEVAKAIAFLASDDASFITGVNLPVDGGRQAMCSG